MLTVSAKHMPFEFAGQPTSHTWGSNATLQPLDPSSASRYRHRRLAMDGQHPVPQPSHSFGWPRPFLDTVRQMREGEGGGA